MRQCVKNKGRIRNFLCFVVDFDFFYRNIQINHIDHIIYIVDVKNFKLRTKGKDGR